MEEKITFDGDVYTIEDIKEMFEAINILARECNRLNSILDEESLSRVINTDGNEFAENALEWAERR